MSEIAPVLVFRSLFANDLVSVRQYQCRACRGGPAPEEQTQTCDAVFMLRGAFCRHTSRRKYNLVDVNHVAFFSPSEPYQVSHPATCGDDGTVVTLSSSLLHDIIRPLYAEVDDKPDRPFLRQIGPCSAQLFRRHTDFSRRLNATNKEEVDLLWFEETAISLVEQAIHATTNSKRISSLPDHNNRLERVEAAKFWLADNLSRKISPSQIAETVGCSEYHFSRILRPKASAASSSRHLY